MPKPLVSNNLNQWRNLVSKVVNILFHCAIRSENHIKMYMAKLVCIQVPEPLSIFTDKYCWSVGRLWVKWFRSVINIELWSYCTIILWIWGSLHQWISLYYVGNMTWELRYSPSWINATAVKAISERRKDGKREKLSKGRECTPKCFIKVLFIQLHQKVFIVSYLWLIIMRYVWDVL